MEVLQSICLSRRTRKIARPCVNRDSDSRLGFGKRDGFAGPLLDAGI